MKKKVNVTFQVQYETEIEVDTDLPEGYYELELEMLQDVYDEEGEPVKITDELKDKVQNIIDSEEVDNIEIPTNGKHYYRKNSFEVVNIIV